MRELNVRKLYVYVHFFKSANALMNMTINFSFNNNKNVKNAFN